MARPTHPRGITACADSAFDGSRFGADLADTPSWPAEQMSGLFGVPAGKDIPFILISGTVGEDVAVEAMKHGAMDYLLKDRIVRLGNAVERALEQQRLRAAAEFAGFAHQGFYFCQGRDGFSIAQIKVHAHSKPW